MFFRVPFNAFIDGRPVYQDGATALINNDLPLTQQMARKRIVDYLNEMQTRFEQLDNFEIIEINENEFITHGIQINQPPSMQ
jgi:hypothetical protein